MNSDFRISVDFWYHPKTKKLIRRLGLEGVRSLQILWAWTAANRPSGSLTGMDDEDIELASDWNGEIGSFVKALKELHWLDQNQEGFVIHDWQTNNPWAADADFRADKARLARLRQVNLAAYEKCVAEGKTSVTTEEYEALKKFNAGDTLANAGETLASSQQDASVKPAPLPYLSLNLKNITYSCQNRPDFDEQATPEETAIEQGSLVVSPAHGCPRCPQEKILSLYREILPGLPQPRKIRPNIAAQVRSRWTEKCEEKGFKTEEQGLEYFRNFFTYVSRNDFLTGRKSSGGRQWRCDYRWLMKAENFDKVTSDYYGGQS